MAKTATKWLIIVSVVIGFSASGWAQDAGKTESSKSNTPFSTRWEQANDVGEVEYLTSCSACHGLDGRGDGPLRGELKSKPADLTVLAKKNNGVFPLNAIYETIDGRKSVSAHGTSITVAIFCWRICLISESMGHHDSEIMDDRGID